MCKIGSNAMSEEQTDEKWAKVGPIELYNTLSLAAGGPSS